MMPRRQEEGFRTGADVTLKDFNFSPEKYFGAMGVTMCQRVYIHFGYNRINSVWQGNRISQRGESYH